MSARYERQQRVLSARERDSLRRKIADIEGRQAGQIIVPQNGTLRAREKMPERKIGYMAQFMDSAIKENAALLRDKKARLMKSLSEGSPDSLSRSRRAALEKREMFLREQLQKRMCPQKLFRLRSTDADFAKATRACLQHHEPQFKKMAAEFKNIRRELDPENPRAGNLEDIRPA